MISCPRWRTQTCEFPLTVPGAALPHAEELLDGLTVQVAGVHAVEHVENSWKPVKSCGFGRYRAGSDHTPRKGAIRHYMVFRRLGAAVA